MTDCQRFRAQVYLEEDARGYMDRAAISSADSSPNRARSWQRVCQLLSRKQDRIEPIKALSLLPGEVGSSAEEGFCKRRLTVWL